MLELGHIANKYGEPMALLIQCCRVHFKTDTIDYLNERIENIGEEKKAAVLKRVQLLSRLHRIRPVVCRVLLNATISPEFKTLLKNELHSITLQNFELAKETARIVKIFEEAGITAIPYKGVAFSKQFYGDISMRESSDIDLVIDPKDLEIIIRLLETDGYKGVGLDGFKRINKERFILKHKDLCFDKEKEFHVEFHWKFIHPNFCISDTIESQPQITEKKLSVNNHLQAIILHHWIHDGYAYLKTILDIAQAIHNDRNNLDLDTINKNSNHGLEIGNYAAQKLFGVYTSFKTSNSIAKKKASIIINDNLSSKAGRQNKNTTITLVKQYYNSYINQVIFADSLFVKVKFTFKFWTRLLMPKQSDYHQVGLPAPLHFLYIFVRAYRLTKRMISQKKI